MTSLVHRIADVADILNAQVQLLGRARVPLSVRLRGRVSVFGEGGLVLGMESVLLARWCQSNSGRTTTGGSRSRTIHSSTSAHRSPRGRRSRSAPTASSVITRSSWTTDQHDI